MANKRTLKRAINLICEELFAESVAVSLYGSTDTSANHKALLYSIIKMQDDYICRVGHPEPGMKPSLYYKDLREKFDAQVNDILNQINGMG
jgi:hypothetical protein